MSDILADLFAMESCGCHVCLDALGKAATFYVLCPECGCKRCPKATNHVHECTGSNDSGQLGSTYGDSCELECCTTYNANQRREPAEWKAMFSDDLDEIRAERIGAAYRVKRNLSGGAS